MKTKAAINQLLLEARRGALMEVRLRPEPYTDRGEADKFIVMRIAELEKEIT